MAWLAEVQVYKAITLSPQAQLVYVIRAQLQRMSPPCILITYSLLSLAAGKGHEVNPPPNTTQVSNCPCQCGPQGPPGPPGRDGRDGLSGPTGATGAPGIDGRDDERGPPGPSGASGRDGRDGKDGAVGPPGVSSGVDWEGIRDIVKLVAQEGCQTCTYPPVAMCPGWSADRPATSCQSPTSCHSILGCNPSAPSGYYYWLLLDHQWNTTSCHVLLHGG